MATRSRIGLEFPDGHVESIYCHWDGYPEHNGRILQSCYNDFSSVYQLIQLGDLSILGESVGEKQDFNRPCEGWCLSYSRDRGERDTHAQRHPSWVEYLKVGEEYSYLFRNGVWLVSGYYTGDFKEF